MAAGKYPDVAYPVACYLSSVRTEMPKQHHQNSIGVLLVFFTIVVIFAPLALLWASRRCFDTTGIVKNGMTSIGWMIRIGFQAVLPLAAFSWGLFAVKQGRSVITVTSSPVSLGNNEQNEWSFGQILPMALIGLVFLFAFEQWPGKPDAQPYIRVPHTLILLKATSDREDKILARGEVDGFFRLPPQKGTLSPTISPGYGSAGVQCLSGETFLHKILTDFRRCVKTTVVIDKQWFSLRHLVGSDRCNEACSGAYSVWTQYS
jgi:hypothetical protein